MFVLHETLGRVDLGFTDRHGGVSTGPWSSLNLGTSNGDDEASVSENLARAARALGADGSDVVLMHQVHGGDVHLVDGAESLVRPVADALVTDRPGAVLVVRVADCVPLVLADDAAGVVGVAHAGRKGVQHDVVTAAVDTMRSLSAQRVTAWIGPRACGRCYEVPAAMRDDVAHDVPATWSETSWGTPALDLGAGVRAQLEASGVTVHDLADHAPACTIEHEDYYSHRRQGERSGRLGGLVRLRP